MEDSFKSLVSSAKSILILLPKTPYFDQVAAGLSLYLSIRDSKEVAIVCGSPMLVEYNRLVGINKIATNPANKNLLITFNEYEATQIERVTYDIVGEEFRLSVTPKEGALPPREDQVKVNYAGINADLVILVGGGNEGHFPELSSPELGTPKIAHVGITELSGGRQGILSFAKPASSASELMAELIKSVNGNFDEDAATNLLAGIYDGSKNFTGPNVSFTTHELVAELMKAGGKRQTMSHEPRRNYPPGAIPGEAPKEEVRQEAPKSWMEPKIYKGTSIS